MTQSEGGRQGAALVRISAGFGQADVGEFEAQQRGRDQTRTLQTSGDSSASGSPNNSAATAEASMTLTPIAVRPHDRRGLGLIGRILDGEISGMVPNSLQNGCILA